MKIIRVTDEFGSCDIPLTPEVQRMFTVLLGERIDHLGFDGDDARFAETDSGNRVEVLTSGDRVSNHDATVERLERELHALTEVWVFGCFHGSGHYLRTAGGVLVSRDTTDLTAVDRTLDSANAARAVQVEGAIVRCRSVPLPSGWSFVSWWDRKGDPRYGSHTGILARGTWTDTQLIAAGKRLVPWAFRVEVTE